MVDYLHKVGQTAAFTTKGEQIEMKRDVKCISTGYDIIDPNREQHEYEFSKSISNMIYALFCRLFVSKVVSDDGYTRWMKNILAAREIWYHKELDKLENNGVMDDIIREHDPITRIIMHPSYSKCKKCSYLVKIVEQGAGSFPRLKVYSSFVKSGEVYPIKQDGD